MRADTDKARSAAQGIIREFAIKNPPVPIERIIKSKNIVLRYAPLEEELSSMAYIKDGIGIIGVNALHHRYGSLPEILVVRSATGWSRLYG